MQDALVALAAVRRDLAALVGSPSYMHYRMQGAALAQDPADVSAFLGGLAVHHRSAAAPELEHLQRCARDSGLLGRTETIGMWDLALARQQGLQQELRRRGLGGEEPGFSVKLALGTLFRVVDRLFGVQFEQVPCSGRCATAH